MTENIEIVEAAQIKSVELKKYYAYYECNLYYEIKFIRLKNGQRVKIYQDVNCQLSSNKLHAKVKEWIKDYLKNAVIQENSHVKALVENNKHEIICCQLKGKIITAFKGA